MAGQPVGALRPRAIQRAHVGWQSPPSGVRGLLERAAVEKGWAAARGRVRLVGRGREASGRRQPGAAEKLCPEW